MEVMGLWHGLGVLQLPKDTAQWYSDSLVWGTFPFLLAKDHSHTP